MITNDIDIILEEVYTDVKPQQMISLKPVRKKCGIYDTKLGGIPYFPKSIEYPKGSGFYNKDKPLKLLVQLNFEQIPKLPDFPDHGILQIFIESDSDMYGFNPDSPNVQSGFRVIYHDRIITNTSDLYSENDMPDLGNEGSFPFKGEFILESSHTTLCYPDFNDYRFTAAFIECYNRFTKSDAKGIWDLDDNLIEYVFSKNGKTGDAYIGGFPCFTQDDPRSYNISLQSYDTVLFELMSTDEISWGDCGTGVFMINRKNLLKSDFSDILYNYDCC